MKLTCAILQVVVDTLVFAIMAGLVWILANGIEVVLNTHNVVSYGYCFLASLVFHEISDSLRVGWHAGEAQVAKRLRGR